MRYHEQALGCMSFGRTDARTGGWLALLWLSVSYSLGLGQDVRSGTTAGWQGESAQPNVKAEEGTIMPTYFGIAESLKRFIADPPAFEMIAQVCNRDRRSTNQTFSCYCVLLRYQTNGFFYREAPELVDLSTTNLFPTYRLAGFYAEEYWDFSADGMTLVYGTNKVVSLCEALKHVLAKASKVANLGIIDSLPRSVRWEKNAVRDLTNHYGVTIRGSLALSNGLPAGLHLIAEHNGISVPWEIGYEFSPTKELPAFLPTSISGWSTAQGHRLHNFDLRLVRVALRDLPFPRESFMPGPFAERVSHYVLSTPKGDYSSDRLDKSLRPLTAPRSIGASGRRAVALVFLAVNLVLAGAMALRGWRSGKSEEERK